MSRHAIHAKARTEPRIERWQPWIAALSSALLHVLFVLVAMLAPPVTVSTPQGSESGSPMVVDFVGITPPQPEPLPPDEPAKASQAAETPPAASRLRTTLVARAEDPVPPPRPRPEAREPEPARVRQQAGQGRAESPAAPPPTDRRRSRNWGLPPGMLPRNTSPVAAGAASGPPAERGHASDAASAEPRLSVGGYQVYYDLRSERRLRAWFEQGMTELFLPLPGTRQLMVCPLEIALRKDSGACRLMEPDDPALAAIGDARDVINMMQVYRRGELVWRGPGPYR